MQLVDHTPLAQWLTLAAAVGRQTSRVLRCRLDRRVSDRGHSMITKTSHFGHTIVLRPAVLRTASYPASMAGPIAVRSTQFGAGEHTVFYK